MRVRLVLILSAATLVAIGSAVVALASNFGSSETPGAGGFPDTAVSLGNNQWHYVWDDTTASGMSSALSYAMANEYDTQSDVDMLSGTSSVHDVKAQTGFHPQYWPVAFVDCPPGATTTGSHPNRTCYGQELEFNMTHSSYYNSIADRRAMACHELGHTLGLQHNSLAGSCMNPSSLYTSLTSHDISHLDANY